MSNVCNTNMEYFYRIITTRQPKHMLITVNFNFPQPFTGKYDVDTKLFLFQSPAYQYLCFLTINPAWKPLLKIFHKSVISILFINQTFLLNNCDWWLRESINWSLKIPQEQKPFICSVHRCLSLFLDFCHLPACHNG